MTNAKKKNILMMREKEPTFLAFNITHIHNTYDQIKFHCSHNLATHKPFFTMSKVGNAAYGSFAACQFLSTSVH